jgi:vacuolar protein sorting-associated protein 41
VGSSFLKKVRNPHTITSTSCCSRTSLLTYSSSPLEKEPLLGFACGHVYHLTCLLRANPDTDDEDTIERLLSQLGYSRDSDADGTAAYTGRSVGAKVAHAQVIKNIVQGGCRHCVLPDGA